MNPKDQGRARGEDSQEHELAELKDLLRQAMPPLSANQLEPHTDLWPQLRARINSQLVAEPTGSSPVPWFDWALAAFAAAALIFFPGIIPALLYHF